MATAKHTVEQILTAKAQYNSLCDTLRTAMNVHMSFPPVTDEDKATQAARTTAYASVVAARTELKRLFVSPKIGRLDVYDDFATFTPAREIVKADFYRRFYNSASAGSLDR